MSRIKRAYGRSKNPLFCVSTLDIIMGIAGAFTGGYLSYKVFGPKEESTPVNGLETIYSGGTIIYPVNPLLAQRWLTVHGPRRTLVR